MFRCRYYLQTYLRVVKLLFAAVSKDSELGTNIRVSKQILLRMSPPSVVNHSAEYTT